MANRLPVLIAIVFFLLVALVSLGVFERIPHAELATLQTEHRELTTKTQDLMQEWERLEEELGALGEA